MLVVTPTRSPTLIDTVLAFLQASIDGNPALTVPFQIAVIAKPQVETILSMISSQHEPITVSAAPQERSLLLLVAA